MRSLRMKVLCLCLPAVLVVLGSTAAMADYISTVMADNPIGYWRLGESGGTSAADSSGNGHTGTTGGVAGVTLGGATGAIKDDTNAGAYFAGSSSKTYITVADESAFAFNIENAFSIEAWVKPATSTNSNVIASKDNHFTGTTYAGYYLVIDPTYGPYFQLEGSSTAYLYKYASSITQASLCDGKYHHIVATYDGSNTLAGMNMYVDGAVIATTDGAKGTITSLTNTQPFYIGRKSSGSSYTKFNGDMDEVAVYGSSLDASDVLTHYNTALGIPEPSTIALLFTGLMGMLAYAWRKRK